MNNIFYKLTKRNIAKAAMAAGLLLGGFNAGHTSVSEDPNKSVLPGMENKLDSKSIISMSSNDSISGDSENSSPEGDRGGLSRQNSPSSPLSTDNKDDATLNEDKSDNDGNSAGNKDNNVASKPKHNRLLVSQNVAELSISPSTNKHKDALASLWRAGNLSFRGAKAALTFTKKAVVSSKKVFDWMVWDRVKDTKIVQSSIEYVRFYGKIALGTATIGTLTYIFLRTMSPVSPVFRVLDNIYSPSFLAISDVVGKFLVNTITTIPFAACKSLSILLYNLAYVSALGTWNLWKACESGKNFINSGASNLFGWVGSGLWNYTAGIRGHLNSAYYTWIGSYLDSLGTGVKNYLDWSSKSADNLSWHIISSGLSTLYSAALSGAMLAKDYINSGRAPEKFYDVCKLVNSSYYGAPYSLYPSSEL